MLLAHALSRRSARSAAAAAAARAFASSVVPAPPVTPYTRGPPASDPASRTVTRPGQADVGDLRSASALGLGDGITDHTAKWLSVRAGLGGSERSSHLPTPGVEGEWCHLWCVRAWERPNSQPFPPIPPRPQPDSSIAGNTKSPADWIAEAPPIKVHGAVAVSTGSDDPALGCPVEYIDLRGTSVDNPAVCKYTGLRYYSDDWAHSH